MALSRTRTANQSKLQIQQEASTKPAAEKTAVSQDTFNKIHKKFNEEQKEIFRKLADLNLEVASNELDAAYKFGEQVFEAANASQESKYGKNFVSKLAKLLGRNSSFLYERKRFFEKVKDNFDKLIGIRMKASNMPLTYSHVIAAVDQDDTTFWKYIQQAADNSWTVSQFKSVIKTNKGGRKSNERRGRTVSVPSSVDGQITDIEQVIPRLNKRASLWTDGSSGLLGLLDEVPRDKINQKTVMRITSLMEELEKTSDLMQKLNSQLSDFIGEVAPKKAEDGTDVKTSKASGAASTMSSFRNQPSLSMFGFDSDEA